MPQMYAEFRERCIENAPAADVDPVRHGEWEYAYKSGYKPREGVVCGVCNCRNNRRGLYCPVCGARMDGAAHD